MKVTAVLAALLVVSVSADGHDWTEVFKDGPFEFDFANNDLQIKTDNVLSGDLVGLQFTTFEDSLLGSVFVTAMGDSIVYQVPSCFASRKSTKPDESFFTSGSEKIFTFSFDTDKMEIMCDGQFMITLSFSECYDSSLWGQKQPNFVQFESIDSASKEYRAESKNEAEKKCDFEWEVPCDSGDQCIDGSYICDGDRDCEDGSDEAKPNCEGDSGEEEAGEDKGDENKCDYNETPCESGDQCIISEYICDGDRDCDDGSDEAYWRECDHEMSTGTTVWGSSLVIFVSGLIQIALMV